MKAVEIRDLRYVYPDGRVALDGISLDVEQGESVAIIGPNGAGKSTLLLHLNGLLRGRGSVRIFAQKMAAANLRDIRRRIGLVFQNPDDQLFMPDVLSDVAFGPLNTGCSAEEAPGVVSTALAAVGLRGFEERSPQHLSMGEKKRVAIAGVVAMNCGLLALDEPSAGLDPGGRRALIRLIAELDVTKIIASHDLEMVLELCERVALLDAGKIVRSGAARELLADDELLARHGLEKPLSLRCAAAQEPPLSETN